MVLERRGIVLFARLQKLAEFREARRIRDQAIPIIMRDLVTKCPISVR